jgi:hypothetical protein
MNENEMNPPRGLNDQVAALQRQVFALLLALVVVSGTLTVYLYRQASILGKDIASDEQRIAAVNQGETIMVSLANQLAAYAKTHPDIAPLLAKYGVGPGGIPVAPAPKK